jgi:hypothetical protein
LCYFLYVATPLTLSEVRSMLPSGITGDLAPSQDQRTLRALHPAAQTVVRLLAGRCSCDLVRRRLPDSREDERHLRERYRQAGASRPEMILALERHRSGTHSGSAEDLTRAVAGFVAEHARNAGPTLYLLQFSAGPDPIAVAGPVHHISVAQVGDRPREWLKEGALTLVSR